LGNEAGGGGREPLDECGRHRDGIVKSNYTQQNRQVDGRERLRAEVEGRVGRAGRCLSLLRPSSSLYCKDRVARGEAGFRVMWAPQGPSVCAPPACASVMCGLDAVAGFRV
jgi:hypothetical protein